MINGYLLFFLIGFCSAVILSADSYYKKMDYIRRLENRIRRMEAQK